MAPHPAFLMAECGPRRFDRSSRAVIPTLRVRGQVYVPRRACRQEFHRSG